MADPSSAGPRANLRDLFSALQEELCAALHADRTAFDHPGARGETTELDWAAMLSKYLPARYRASKAFVVDADGLRSEQIDLVLYDRQYCPFFFTRHGNHYIPAESVYAVFEIKQALNSRNVTYAGGKASSVRRLRRTSAPIPHAGGMYEPRPLFNVLAGILALDSDWSPPLGDALVGALRDLPERARLDMGCSLRHGAFEAHYGADIGVRTSAPENALIDFFLSLLKRLQALATVPAMDLAQYARVLGEESSPAGD